MVIKQANAQNRAVGGYKRQVYAERLIKRRAALFDEHFNYLHQAGYYQYEHYGVQVSKPKRHEQISVYKIGEKRGKSHYKRDGETHAGSGFDLVGYAEEWAVAKITREYEVVGKHAVYHEQKHLHYAAHARITPFSSLFFFAAFSVK